MVSGVVESEKSRGQLHHNRRQFQLHNRGSGVEVRPQEPRRAQYLHQGNNTYKQAFLAIFTAEKQSSDIPSDMCH